MAIEEEYLAPEDLTEDEARSSADSDSRERESVEEEASDKLEGDTISLLELSSDEFLNPLNPKTKENLDQKGFVSKTVGRTVIPSSRTVGRRWISVQAYNHDALIDDFDTAYDSIGLVISVNKKPVNGSPFYDEVVNVEDITPYVPSQWSGGTEPTHGSTFSTDFGTDHIVLKYKKNAFATAPGYGNYITTNGVYYVDIKVTFASGHEEYFTSQGFQNDNGPIMCPVGTQYRNQITSNSFQYSQSWGVLAEKEQKTQACSTSFFTQNAWYSKGANIIKSQHEMGDYSIVTRYKPIHNPAGTLSEGGWYREYFAGITTSQQSYVHLINPITLNWGDPLATWLGDNGIVTPDQNTTARQSFSRIDVLFSHNTTGMQSSIFGTGTSTFLDETWFHNNWTAINPSTYYDNSFTGSQDSSFDNLTNAVGAANQNQYLFTYTAYYSHNITSCTAPPQTSYQVCADPGNPSYYLTTLKDCNNATIPAADLPGGANNANVTFVSTPACCTVCTLTTTVTTQDATYGNSDGIVFWNARDLGAPSGNPWNSGSMYTVTVKDSSGAAVGVTAPSGSNTFTDNTCDTNTTTGTAHLVTCNASNKIVPGMQVSGTGIPAVGTVFVGAITAGTVSSNVTQFSLVDTSGALINANAIGTNVTLTFSTGDTGQQGQLAITNASNPFYEICITDEDGCEECTQFVIREPSTPPSGCTDSTAINYDANATVDDGSCILCNAANGLLEDPAGTNTTPLFDSTNAVGTSATWNSNYGSSTTHNSDGTLAVTASPIASAIAYMDWDANSKFELLLYKTVNQGEPSTATGAVQIGGTINAGTLDIVTVASHTFTGLAYGYYTIRVRYVDTNTTSTLEDCWTEFYGVVQAQVCSDATNVNYMSVPADPALQDSQNNILCDNSLPCCTLQNVTEAFDMGACDPYLYSQVWCDPGRTVDVVWEFSANGSSWISIGTYSIGYTQNSGVLLYAAPGNNINAGNFYSQNGSGFYRVKITATTAHGHDTCIEEKLDVFSYPISGCSDPTAHNYDPAAKCPGQCVYPSWDCDQATGNCYDPWNGTLTGYTPGQYNCLNGPGCCNSSCQPPIVYGCTDSCATNYDPTATNDDGSCTYTACLDPQATNYQQNCCNQSYYSSGQIIGPDNSCCINPCSITNFAITGITDATSTCTTFNNDGTATLTYTINNGATTWTWELLDVQGNLIYTDGVTYTGSGTMLSTYSTLGTGNYSFRVTDNFGCVTNSPFTINSSGPAVGCTDPNATNYDPAATCDCGCCYIAGCIDPTATNYNPNASVPDGSCEYADIPPSPCLPKSLEDNKLKVNVCISQKGSRWLRDYKIGRTDDCSLMNKWKLILIDYLLKQHELSCLFNCADLETPGASSLQDCNDLWVTGGPSTGLNHDPNHEGATIATGEGTTITAYDGYPTGWFGYVPGGNPSSNKSFVGDVVKFDLPVGHPLATWLNGTIWTLTANPANNPTGMHQGCKLSKIQHYTQCLDYRTISTTTTVNYYDKFINFVNKFCADCDTKILTNKNS